MSEPLPKDEFDRIFSKVPRLTVEVLITSEERGVLLALRDVDPCRGMWNLPGGTVRFGERLVDAVRRVAANELGCPSALVRWGLHRVPQPLRERA